MTATAEELLPENEAAHTDALEPLLQVPAAG